MRFRRCRSNDLPLAHLDNLNSFMTSNPQMVLLDDVFLCFPTPEPALNSCAVNNGGCEHDCVQLTANQHQCRCRRLHRLREDGRRCACECQAVGGGMAALHVELCGSFLLLSTPVWSPCAERNGGCMQLCRDVRGAARCECHPGYRLGPDGRACQGELLRGQAALPLLWELMG